MITGLSYSASTPNLYKNQKHGSIGWIIFFLALGLSSAQIVRASVILFLKRDKDVPFSARLKHLLRGSDKDSNSYSAADAADYELVGRESGDSELFDADHVDDTTPHSARTLVNDEQEEDLQRRAVFTHHHQAHQTIPENVESEESKAQYWRRPHRQEMSLDLHRHLSRSQDRSAAPRALRGDSHGGESSRTASSDETLHETYNEVPYTMSPGVMSPLESHLPHKHFNGQGESQVPFRQPRSQLTRMATVLKYGEIFLWRSMVLMGWVAFMTGCITYWGGCRSPYIVSLARLLGHSLPKCPCRTAADAL